MSNSNADVNVNYTNLNRNVSGISPLPVKELFDGTGRHFSAAEIEFLAENCLISIKPRRKLEEIDLLSVH